MRPMRRLVVAALLAGSAVAALPAAAGADIFAVTEAQSPSGDLDLAYLDVSTGQRLPLPAGVNTSADEFHPSLTPDGKRVVFERVDSAAGTTRIVLTDLATGTSADLLSAFQVASLSPNDPAFITSVTVALGRPLESSGTGLSDRRAKITTVNTSQFPNGPYPVSDFSFPHTLNSPGRSLQFDRHGQLVTGVHFDDKPQGAVIAQTLAGMRILRGTDSFDDPTVSASQQVVVLVRSPVLAGGALGPGRLVFVPFSLAGPTALPDLVQGQPERPEFTDDGRYLAFVRQQNGQFRLFVWDTQTQLLLDPAGIDLGALSSAQDAMLRLDGAVTLHQAFVVLSSSIKLGGQISFRLATPSDIGIIVQKVVGRTRVLGHPAPKLRLVGRVPLGHFRSGRGHVRWNRKVGGHSLPPGRYQLTVRSLTARGKVQDLGHPELIAFARRGNR